MTTPLSIEQARAYVSKMDPAISGQGGHDQCYKVACKLVQMGLTRTEAWTVLCEYNHRCLPPWSEWELQHKLHDAFRNAGRPPMPKLETISRPAPTMDPVTAAEIFLNNFRAGEADLWELSSPRPPEDWRADGSFLVSVFYRPNEAVNVVTDYELSKDGKARPAGSGVTLERDELIERLAHGEFQSDAGGWLRMNPLDGKGIADANVTAYRFALIECDTLPIDLQLSLFARLPLPIAAILSSGGRSLHAWVKVDCKNHGHYKAEVSAMLGILACYGVDGKNKNPSRLSRLPGAQRKIGVSDGADGRQRLLYVNAEPEKRDRIIL